MDKNEIQKNIALYYSKLPQKAQEFFAKMEWLEKIQKIGIKYGLNEKQKETLGIETTLMLLGIINILEYEAILNKELLLSKDSVDKILIEIKDTILKDVTEEINTAFNTNAKQDEVGQTELSQKTNGRFAKLPEAVIKVIEDSNYLGMLYDISRKYSLNVTDMGALEKATTDTIAGDIKPENLESYLGGVLTLNKDKIKELVAELNEQIFKKIREKMMQINKTPVRSTPIEISTPNTQISKSDEMVLNKAGIDITPKTNNLPVPEVLELEPANKINNEILPILAQKLSGYVQNDVVATEHVVDNAKPKIQITTPPPVKTDNVKPKVESYAKGADPYRLLPE